MMCNSKTMSASQHFSLFVIAGLLAFSSVSEAAATGAAAAAPVASAAASPTQPNNGAPRGMKNCTANKVDNGCPLNAACQQKENQTEAFCVCIKGFTFNPKYENDTTYCQNGTTKANGTTPSVVVTVPSAASAITTVTSKSAAAVAPPAAAVTAAPPAAVVPAVNNEVTKQRLIDTKPESHHFFAGILLPLFVVFAFIGAVFAVRKYDLIERAQEYIESRSAGRHRTNYANDFDEFDDPLLI